MKKKLLFILAMLTTGVGMTWADAIPSANYSEKAAGTYYLYNIGENKFYNTSGTNVSQLGLGLTSTVTLTENADHTFNIQTNNGYLKLGHYEGTYLWSNGASGDTKWTLTETGTGTKIYTISSVATITENNSPHADESTWYIYGSGTSVNATWETTGSNTWALIEAQNINTSNSYLDNTDFATNIDGWTNNDWARDSGGKAYLWNNSGGLATTTLSQTVKGQMPAGTYLLTYTYGMVKDTDFGENDVIIASANGTSQEMPAVAHNSWNVSATGWLVFTLNAIGTPTVSFNIKEGNTLVGVYLDDISLCYLGSAEDWTTALTTLVETVSAPTIGLSAASAGSRTVSITPGVSNKGNSVKTYYTTNGTTPTASSTQYSEPFAITSTTTVKAITISDTENTSSSVAEATFTIGSGATTTYDMTTGLLSLPAAVKQSDNTELTLTAAGAQDVFATKGTWGFNNNNDLQGTANSDFSILNVSEGDVVIINTYASWVHDNMLLQTANVTTEVAGNDVVYTVGSGCTQIDFKQKDGNQWIGITNIIVESSAARTKVLNFTDGDASLVLNKSFTVDNVSYTRSFTANNWSTLCLPFTVAKPSGLTTVKALKDATTEGDVLTLDFSGDDVTELQAGVPYMVKPNTTSVTFSVTTGTPTITNTVTNTEKTAATFVGTLTNTTVPEGSFYVKSNAFYEAPAKGDTDGVSCKGFRAYITPKVSAARTVRFIVDGETTAIEGIANSATANVSVYNLQGQRVGQPTKGLYIIGGKKVIMK